MLSPKESVLNSNQHLYAYALVHLVFLLGEWGAWVLWIPKEKAACRVPCHFCHTFLHTGFFNSDERSSPSRVVHPYSLSRVVHPYSLSLSSFINFPSLFYGYRVVGPGA